MKELRKRLNGLDKNNNKEDRVIFQAIDLLSIKYNGLERYAMDGEISAIVDALIMDWFWMYDKGYSMSASPKAQMNEEELDRYESMVKRFSKFQEFMQSNMSLVE